ncbi:hypothetical protein JCM10512_4630 [Bacteroides reticulotermitis JCM 10512]|uniref:Uncharacterized protein n=1 Tax=Bacteroides reticulotermitis JCM 10512 TaxID=1445607 RepID=W4V074_9BACE|nr:hypothetical protein JCM10512_4630 [Bacteroides reticulotermitis JCM 10512]
MCADLCSGRYTHPGCPSIASTLYPDAVRTGLPPFGQMLEAGHHRLVCTGFYHYYFHCSFFIGLFHGRAKINRLFQLAVK